jgi:hypothetical protein
MDGAAELVAVIAPGRVGAREENSEGRDCIWCNSEAHTRDINRNCAAFSF